MYFVPAGCDVESSVCMQDDFVPPYQVVVHLFQDQIVGDFVAELLDYLDYCIRVENIACRPRRISWGTRVEYTDGSLSDPVDLTDE